MTTSLPGLKIPATQRNSLNPPTWGRPSTTLRHNRRRINAARLHVSRLTPVPAQIALRIDTKIHGIRHNRSAWSFCHPTAFKEVQFDSRLSNTPQSQTEGRPVYTLTRTTVWWAKMAQISTYFACQNQLNDQHPAHRCTNILLFIASSNLDHLFDRNILICKQCNVN
jgi:hypothetical protein